MKLFLMMMSCCGLLMADTYQEAKVQVNADGSKHIEGPDGSIVDIKTDGTTLIRKTDGTSVEIKPDGSKTIRSADGALIQVPAGK